MVTLFDKTGVMAIGTRLRMLSERLAKDAEKMMALYDIDIKLKWYPVIFELIEDENPKTVTEIANEIGQSHVSVLKIVREMSKVGMIIESKDENDGRKTNLQLSDFGKERIGQIEFLHKDVTLAIEKMLEGTTHNLWYALDEFEELLDKKSTYPRVLDEQRKRESQKIKIVEFEDKYLNDFVSLNKEWIDKYFEMESRDEEILSQPKENILSSGGTILVALYDDEVVGVCALMKSKNESYEYELAKMAVKPKHQGKGIGLFLGEAIIEKARELKAEAIYLESNTVLKTAINLYRKLGFKKVVGYKSTYGRSNIKMELILD